MSKTYGSVEQKRAVKQQRRKKNKAAKQARKKNRNA